MELRMKRKQKIERWGKESGSSSGGKGGFGRGESDRRTNNQDKDDDDNKNKNSNGLKSIQSQSQQQQQQRNRDKKERSETIQSSQKMTAVTNIPILTAAEYARLNVAATKQRDVLDESKRFVTEYLDQQQLLPTKRVKGQVVQISSDPLIFVIDDFINPELCRMVDNQANGCFQLSFPETVAEQLFQGQASELDGLLFNRASSQDHERSTTTTTTTSTTSTTSTTTTTKPNLPSHLLPRYPDGLHMDTNNQCLFRHVTCILYLNDVLEECGGATVFPIGRAVSHDPAFIAAQRLLDHSISHTKSREIIAFGLEEEVRILEDRMETNCLLNPNQNTAIKIQPKAGRLLVFFSRDEYGRQDPRTWHAGERILRPNNSNNKKKDVDDDSTTTSSTNVHSVTEKRILTLFKEIDYEEESRQRQEQECTLEAFLAPQVAIQRRWLKAKAELQKVLLNQIGGPQPVPEENEES